LRDWQAEYQRKLISAEEAGELVKSGDYVFFTSGREAHSIGLAISARKEELRDVKIFQPYPGYDFGWHDPGWEDSFQLTLRMPTAISQRMTDERRCDLQITDIAHSSEVEGIQMGIIITEVSTPDDKGFCSFGASLWNKKEDIKRGRLVIAEVNENLIRTFGDNFVHVSEIDYFVKHESAGGNRATGTLAGRKLKQPEPYLKQIAENISRLIKDGDTIQIGVGRATEPLVQLGIFDNKCDLGWHSEATPPGAISLIRENVINGKYKTINKGKVVVTSLGGASKEDMDWANNNPLFWLFDVKYIWDVRVISAHDNMVAINNALIIDLSGQISVESLGTRSISTAGGQTAFVIGALYSKGGRSITVLPSTAERGTSSRIVPMLEKGARVTIPCNCTDYVITEYGVACLRGESLRHRAEKLISIAHPDFRSELRKEAQKIYWP
jgi:4-hydroxybutyrate CoA-transferase